MSTDDIASALEGMPAWSHAGDELVATFQRKDWLDALGFVNEVGAEAQRRDHHPDVCITRYRVVTFRLSTHSAGGVTERDVSLATWISEAAER